MRIQHFRKERLLGQFIISRNLTVRIPFQHKENRAVFFDSFGAILQEDKVTAVQQIFHPEHIHGIIPADTGGVFHIGALGHVGGKDALSAFCQTLETAGKLGEQGGIWRGGF